MLLVLYSSKYYKVLSDSKDHYMFPGENGKRIMKNNEIKTF